MSIKSFIFFSFFLCSIAQYSNAQEVIAPPPPPETPKIKLQHEVGINATLLVKQFLSFGANSNIPISPYIFAYKLTRKGHGIRLGAGVTSVSLTETQETFADTKTITNESINARFGYEYQHLLGEKWTSWVGLDAVYGNMINKNISDSGFDRVTLSNGISNKGGALALGLQYNINKHLSIATEANVQATYQINAERKAFSSSGQPTSDKTSKGWNISTLAPTSIFIIFKL
jgi:hypothetical protein